MTDYESELDESKKFGK